MRHLLTSLSPALLLTLLVSACAGQSRLPPAHIANDDSYVLTPAHTRSSVKLITLNAAHSRSMGLHQFLQSSDTAKEHLDDVAAMLERENADIVALQEVDGPSIWSGRFDHVDYIASVADYPQTVRGTHALAPGFDYGTAILARHALTDPASLGFKRPIAFTKKGFVVSTIRWPGTLDLEVDVVSVHLDPLRHGTRQKQVKEMAAFLQERGRPVIIMGDFNGDWYDENSAIRILGQDLGLQPHGPRCEECRTHRRLHRYVDWILASPEFEFLESEILGDELSDHYAVSATLRLKPAVGDSRS